MSIKVAVTRSLWFNGKIVEPGTVLTLPASTAADMVDGSNRCVLLNAEDGAAVAAARQAAVKAILRHERSSGGNGSPWMPLNY
jgi:hypothetical protein